MNKYMIVRNTIEVTEVEAFDPADALDKATRYEHENHWSDEKTAYTVSLG